MKLEQNYEQLLKTGLEISTQKDKEQLLALLLERSMEIARCDGGMLYQDGEEGIACSIIQIRHRKPERAMASFLSVGNENVSAYTARKRICVNIPDIHNDNRFQYDDIKCFESQTGCQPGSLLSVPVENHAGELVGVLLLVNARDGEGKVISFGKQHQMGICSMASLAAVEWSNLSYTEELKALLRSFVEAFATAVDERTPYNGTHTRKVAQYAAMLADYMNQKHETGECEEYFDKEHREKIVLAALLHDIGKMIIPLSIMNRASRMDGCMEQIEKRFELLRAYYEIDWLNGRITQEQYHEKRQQLMDELEFIYKIDEMNELDEENYKRIKSLSARTYTKPDGTQMPYLTRKEIQCLSIRRGTLTDDDRKWMENHVVMTAKILSKVHFNNNYSMIPRWAARHHELLDGTGYPEHLTGDRIEIESRILTVADIYDALTAQDRPYKEPMPQEEAMKIMRNMAQEGKLEMRLVNWLEAALEQCSPSQNDQTVDL